MSLARLHPRVVLSPTRRRWRPSLNPSEICDCLPCPIQWIHGYNRVKLASLNLWFKQADPILAQQALRPNEKPSKARRVLIGYDAKEEGKRLLKFVNKSSKAPAPESISTKDADKSSDPSLVQRNVQALQREVLVLSNELMHVLLMPLDCLDLFFFFRRQI